MELNVHIKTTSLSISNIENIINKYMSEFNLVNLHTSMFIDYIGGLTSLHICNDGILSVNKRAYEIVFNKILIYLDDKYTITAQIIK